MELELSLLPLYSLILRLNCDKTVVKGGINENTWRKPLLNFKSLAI